MATTWKHVQLVDFERLATMEQATRRSGASEYHAKAAAAHEKSMGSGGKRARTVQVQSGSHGQSGGRGTLS